MSLFGGGSQKHPKLDQLSQIVQNSLGLQLTAPDNDVLGIIETMTPHDFIGIQNARSIEGAQEILKTKSLRAMVDPETRTIALSVASPDEIEQELKTAHSAVSVMHVGLQHHSTSHIIRSFNPTTEPVKETATPSGTLAPQENVAPPVPPAFEHLEAAERLCPVVVDLFVKHGQLTSADKEVLKKIKPVDYTLEARISSLERWKAEVTRRGRGVHVQQGGPTSLLAGGEGTQNSEEAVLRRFETFLHWLGKLIKALEHKGIKFHGRPVWLH